MNYKIKKFVGIILFFILILNVFFVGNAIASSTSNFKIEILPVTPPITAVNFKGMAAPLSFVTLLKDGQIVAITQSGPDAGFDVSLSGLSAGTYVFSLYADDVNNRRTSTISFTIYVTNGVTTQISGIFLSPTIGVDKEVVARGEILSIFGKSKPESNVSVNIDTVNGINAKTIGSIIADNNGLWLYNVDTSTMEYGDYAARARASVGNGGSISDLSPRVEFKISEVSKKKKERACPTRADLKTDCKVNVIDMSILAYWWGRELTDWAKNMVDGKLKKDGIIDIRDLSVMAYYWTG